MFDLWTIDVRIPSDKIREDYTGIKYDFNMEALSKYTNDPSTSM